jgi:hypothetical protein
VATQIGTLLSKQSPVIRFGMSRADSATRMPWTNRWPATNRPGFMYGHGSRRSVPSGGAAPLGPAAAKGVQLFVNAQHPAIDRATGGPHGLLVVGQLEPARSQSARAVAVAVGALITD